MEYKIELKGIAKTFQSKRQTIHAVSNCSFGVENGEFISLVGPSGCGKSTIIRMIDGIIAPSAGTITVDGVTYADQIPPEILQKIGFVFQQHNLLPWMTVRQNLELPLKVFKLSGPQWKGQVERLLEYAKLQDCQGVYVNELSIGMQQRLGVIRAMVHDPEILLMDEPFASLDETTRNKLDIDLLDIWAETGKTIIFITHSIAEAVLLSSRVFVMKTNPGEIVSEVPVPIPRPRTLESMTSRDFLELCDQITGTIGHIDLSKIK